MSRSKTSKSLLRCLAIAAFVAVAVTATACGTGAPSAAQPSGMPVASAPASSGAGAGPAVQLCAECGGLGAAKETTGEATPEGGVQVVSIAIVGGYYVPNRITAKAGAPIRVVFTGSAKGCVAKPTFASLGKSGDLTGTGSTTIELGSLAAGTYGFSCAMGANKGTITVQ